MLSLATCLVFLAHLMFPLSPEWRPLGTIQPRTEQALKSAELLYYQGTLFAFVLTLLSLVTNVGSIAHVSEEDRDAALLVLFLGVHVSIAFVRFTQGKTQRAAIKEAKLSFSRRPKP